MLEDWIDLRTSGNHAQLNNLYYEINDKSQEEWPGLAKDQRSQHPNLLTS